MKTTISNSWDYPFSEGKSERLADLCAAAGGSDYISSHQHETTSTKRSSPSAASKLTWFDYTGYPDYPQLWGGMIHEVSILDLLFNCGRDAHRYMRYVRA